MRNIIITGGGFGNKGAEAMTYVTVSEIRERFPKHKIYLFLPEKDRLEKDFKSNFNFDFLGWHPIKFAKAQSNIITRIICETINRNEYKKTVEIYKNTDLMIDISGYAIGSNWSYKICSDYLDNFEYARAFNIPVYLMPQSFGPFDFVDEQGKIIDKRIADIFPGIKLICAREKEGLEALKNRYKLENITLQPDIVLNNREINYSGVFKSIPVVHKPEIKDNSVCVIPNNKIMEFGNSNELNKAYVAIIRELLDNSSIVYLAYHSTLDRDICLKLKENFSDEKRVVFLDRDFSCIEYNVLVKQFKYVVASRFHSIVHAYKNGIPCIALGWAQKYCDLLKEFNQSNFFFDVRKPLSIENLIDSIKKLEKNHTIESCKIKEHLLEIQKNNVFDLVNI